MTQTVQRTGTITLRCSRGTELSAEESVGTLLSTDLSSSWSFDQYSLRTERLRESIALVISADQESNVAQYKAAE